MPTLTAAFFAAALLQQGGTPQLDIEALQQEIERQLEDANAPGLSLSIVRGDGVTDIFSAGMADNAAGIPVEDDDLFRSASTLKMVVAAAIVRATLETGTDLHAPIGTIAPDLPSNLHPLTLHQLMTHKAGLLDRTNDYGRMDADALRDSIMELPGDVTFLEPDTAFSYSNIGYNLGGYILEVMTGERFDAALDRLVLAPAGMSRSTFLTETAITLGRADPHWRGQLLERNPENAAEWPSGMMYTTAEDQGRFLAALMNDGVVDGERVWPAGMSALLTHPHVSADETATGFGYGYGVMIGQFGGRDAWFHSGGLPGYRANVLAFPHSQTGAAVLTNGEGFDRTALLNVLFPAVEQSGTAAELALAPIGDFESVGGLYEQAAGLPGLCVFSLGNEVQIVSRHRRYRLRIDSADSTNLVGLDEDGRPATRYRLHRNEDGDVVALSSWVRAFRYTGRSCGD